VAEPQYVSDAAGVTVNLNGSVLVHRSGVSYPPDLATRGVQGTVQAQVKLDGTGAVADVSILSGPDQLRASVLRSVLDWHFSRSEANSTRQISVSFEAPRPASGPVASVAITNVPMLGPATVTTTRTANGTSVRMSAGNTPARIVAIETSGLSEEASRNLLSSLPVHVGEMLTPEVMPKLFYAVRDYDEHLSLTVLPVSGPEVRINIHPQGPGPLAPPPPPPPPPPSGSASSFPAVRVGGAVQNANLITKVAPVYPLLAKQARVQGTVRFETTIGKDGTVQNLQLVSGPPLLVQAAMEAVQQWVYRPTLLNGEPVQVLTTVDINFTLAE